MLFISVTRRIGHVAMQSIGLNLAFVVVGGGLLASCQAAQTAAKWETFRDRRGASLQIPVGWKASIDPSSTRITVAGPQGERVILWPAYLAEPLNAQAASAVLPRVARKLDPSIAWNPPAPAGQTVLRMAGRTPGQAAVCSVTWVNSPRGAAAYFVLSSAPQTQYAALAPAFARIFGSLRLAPPASAALQNVRWSDPKERAFSLEIPANWRMEGGTVRRAAVDVVMAWALTSPDGSVRVSGGDAGLPTFTVPSQMLAMAGFREGSWYSPGYGVRMLVRQYMPGLAFVRSYVMSKMGQGCSDLRITQEQDRTRELAAINAQYAPLRSMGTDLQLTGGDVSFTCQREGSPVSGHYFATTLRVSQAQGGALWTVDQLYGYVAPAGAEQDAVTALSHGLESFEFNPQWLAMQQGITSSVSKIVSQTQAEISRMSRQSFELRQQATSEATRKFSNAMMGLLDARDPLSGRELKVDNAANFHWIDVNGRIVGTQTDTRPSGIDPRLLVTLP